MAKDGSSTKIVIHPGQQKARALAKVILPTQRFGKLVVLEYGGVNKHHQKVYLCQCDCGKQYPVRAYDLRSGKTTHCGCDWRKNPRTRDLIGKRFGKLVVVERLGTEHGAFFNRMLWRCNCDCGNVYDTWTSRLTSHEVMSCGCARRETIASVRAKIKSKNRLPSGLASLHNLLYCYKYGARRRKLAWLLTDAEAKVLFDSPCRYCDEPPFNKHTGSKAPEPYVYTGIDRRDNTLGYTKDNSVPCCKICNRAKLTMTEDEFRAWIKRVHRHFVEGES